MRLLMSVSKVVTVKVDMITLGKAMVQMNMKEILED